MEPFIKSYTKKAASVNINVLALCELLKKKYLLKFVSESSLDVKITDYVSFSIEKRFQTILRSLCSEWADLVSLKTVNQIERLLTGEILKRDRQKQKQLPPDDETSDSPEIPWERELLLIQNRLDEQLHVDMSDFFDQTLKHILASRDMNAVVVYLNTHVVSRLHLPVLDKD